MRHSCVLAVIAAIFSFSSSALAQEAGPPEADRPAPEITAEPVKALPCRPTIACTAEIVPAEALEIEAGYAQRREHAAKLAHGVAALAKYSFTDRFQLQLGSSNVFAMQAGTETRTFDGAFAVGKYQLVKQREVVPAVSLSVLAAAPTSKSPDAVARTYDTNLWLHVTKDAGGFHFDVNAGIDLLGVDQRVAAQTLAAAAASHEIAWGLGAIIEAYDFHGGGSHAANDAGFLSALSYQPLPQMVLDAGADVGFYRDARMTTIFAGLTFVPISSSARSGRNVPRYDASARTLPAAAVIRRP